MKIKALLLSISCAFAFLGSSQCDSSSLIIQPVRASDTDPNISWELYRHYTFFNPDCTPRNTLLLHIVGTHDNPQSTQLYPAIAANNGYHVLSVKYPNDISGQTACASSTDVDCHLKFRKEIIEGVDYSPEVSVDSINCIENRLLRLIQYMNTNYPTQGWGQYVSGNTILWDKIAVSGHSQGGGHAAVLGIDHNLVRVLTFASPNDWSTLYNQAAPFTSATHVTPDSAYYCFNALYDGLAPFNRQYTIAVNLGINNFGDTVNVEYNDCPFQGSHNLYTDRDINGLTNHGLVVYDNHVPIENGKPIYEDVWKYMLGIPCGEVGIEDLVSSEFQLYPNPVQDDLKLIFKNDAERTILIRSIEGKSVFESKVQSAKVSINVDHLKKGTYFLNVLEGEKTSSVRKIVLN